MLRQRNTHTFVVGLRIWLAVIPLAAAALLSFTDQASAQRISTEFTFSAPPLSAQAGKSGVDLNWTAVTGDNIKRDANKPYVFTL